MPSLEILRPGLMTSIQDPGRPGHAYYAVPHGGIMDARAARLALLLLGRAETEPVIEMTAIAPHLLFRGATRMVLTGADFGWQLNGVPVPRRQVIEVRSGDRLTGGPGRAGLRGYLAVDGLLQSDRHFGSAATYPNAGFGGHHGRLLQRGDVLTWRRTPVNDRFTFLPGPEFDRLSAASIRHLATTTYTVDPQSNRMGLRLRGVPLPELPEPLNRSVPVLPGFVQLPPNGLPIVVLQDGQTTGGYPRVAYLREAELWRLNQVELGGVVRFNFGDKTN